LVVTTLDGLRRSTQNLLTLVEELHSRGACLRDLNLGGGDVDTHTPMGSMVFTVMAASTQMELEIRREWTTDPVGRTAGRRPPRSPATWECRGVPSTGGFGTSPCRQPFERTVVDELGEAWVPPSGDRSVLDGCGRRSPRVHGVACRTSWDLENCSTGAQGAARTLGTGRSRRCRGRRYGSWPGSWGCRGSLAHRGSHESEAQNGRIRPGGRRGRCPQVLQAVGGC